MDSKVKVVLVIGNEPAVYHSIKVCLQGYKVIWGNGGIQGIERFKKERPDAVFLDLNMADAYGVDVIKVIRKIDPAVPIIIITAFPGNIKNIDCAKFNIHSYITKPFNTEEIKQKISGIFAG